MTLTCISMSRSQNMLAVRVEIEFVQPWLSLQLILPRNRTLVKVITLIFYRNTRQTVSQFLNTPQTKALGLYREAQLSYY